MCVAHTDESNPTRGATRLCVMLKESHASRTVSNPAQRNRYVCRTLPSTLDVRATSELKKADVTLWPMGELRLSLGEIYADANRRKRVAQQPLTTCTTLYLFGNAGFTHTLVGFLRLKAMQVNLATASGTNQICTVSFCQI